jgi:hypothetical protein
LFPFIYDYYSQIYFIPYLFYFFYNFISSLVILRFALLLIIRLFGLLPFPVIAAFHTIFSHYSHPAPRAALGHTETGSRTGIPEATFRVSPPPPTLPLAVLTPYSSNLFIYIFNFYCSFTWDLFI